MTRRDQHAGPSSLPPRVDYGALRERVRRGETTWWGSLEELGRAPAVLAAARREFADGVEAWTEHLSRRRFLQLAAASVALASAQSCGRVPQREIVPYVHAPEELVPGRPLYFATASTRGGFAQGVVVESHEGRPTKVEGNPRHPASLGATDVFAQASLLGLYDPDRSRSVLHRGEPATWSACLAAGRAALAAAAGEGVRILTGTVTSPTLAAQIARLRERLPQARWHRFEPVLPDAARLGARLAFGRDVDVVHDLERADVVLALDADFLCDLPGSVAYARGFARGRDRGRASAMRGGGGSENGEDDDASREMSRLYVVEPTPSLAGAMADHRLALGSGEVSAFALALAARAAGAGAAGASGEEPALPEGARRWLAPLWRDLQRARGRSLVLAGPTQPAAVHALCHLLNASLGNVGRTVRYVTPSEVDPVPHLESLRELVGDMTAQRVSVLLVLGGNPVYSAPADLAFATALQNVPFALHLGVEADETAALCTWHVPQAHELEAWGDARAHDGTVTIQQPLIVPLYGGRTAAELLAALLGREAASDRDVVREHWRAWYAEHGAGGGDEDFETWWRRTLQHGVVPGTAAPDLDVGVRPGVFAEAAAQLDTAAASVDGDLEVCLRPHPRVWDGTFASNAWLQELPDPHTKLVWDNAVLVSPRLAEELQLRNGDEVELVLGERRTRGGVWVTPGQAPRTVTLHLGYGRRRVGRAGAGAGFDAYALRTSAAPWSTGGLELRRTSGKVALVSAQPHHDDEGRDPVREGDVQRFRAEPTFLQEPRHEPQSSLYPPRPAGEHAFAMTIDLDKCIGCGTCTIACQAENNVPVVGKEQVALGRLMHWIRVDRYWTRDVDQPRVRFQPVPCMHCEKAPCEYVCPVYATVHDHSGLNQMVYNRCIGTRYCSNNCPWKVRRFNFLQYTHAEPEVLQLQRNPDVSVRDRGVMEKCTYCVQRINRGRVRARLEGRPLQDGEIVPACAQACPTEAIVFGDLRDPAARVVREKASPLDYVTLEELNTRPRTSYGARLRNPNPELGDEG